MLLLVSCILLTRKPVDINVFSYYLTTFDPLHYASSYVAIYVFRAITLMAEISTLASEERQESSTWSPFSQTQ